MKTIYIICALMLVLLVVVMAYSILSHFDQKNTSAGKNNTALTENIQEVMKSQYLILRNDSIKEELYVYSYEDGEEYRYSYGLETEFLDKYGNHTASSHFSTGKVVFLSQNKLTGKLGTIQMSDQVWEYTDVVRYKFDEEKKTMTIGDNKYSIAQCEFFSDENKIDVSEISSKDKLLVIGNGPDILSVVITTGHGFLDVTNSSEDVSFIGGYIQVGTKLFAKITGDMELELNEGTYTVAAVSKDGYGDSVEITIQRGDTVELDLATLQGEGPKKGQVTFKVDAPDAVLTIDNNVYDIGQPVELAYGLHTFRVRADGYEDFARYLFVNSESANVVVNLAEVGVPVGSETETESETETQTETQKESETTSETTSQSASEAQTSKNDNYSDYVDQVLSTLSTVLGQ